jgi:hypothetical protein
MAKRFMTAVTSVLFLLFSSDAAFPQTSDTGVTPFAPPKATAEDNSIFDEDRTLFGFFPSSPAPSLQAVLSLFEGLSRYADFVLLQPNIPWKEFVDTWDGQSKTRNDIINQVVLSRHHGLEAAVVVDPLNGLDRREFHNLPFGWRASFGNERIRRAYLNFVRWVVREFEPRYLGLASEINTYMDAHPEDAPNFVSLYTEAYRIIKDLSPATQVFVTFQWDDLRNMISEAAEGRKPNHINWEQVEGFEPNLDLWAISSYPYFVFGGDTPIPSDYYTPLLNRTDKPLAVAEGGFSTGSIGAVTLDYDDQIGYLEAIHEQLGGRLSFWVYLLLYDLDMDALEKQWKRLGLDPDDFGALSLFADIGLEHGPGSPKPALGVWDGYREDAREAR